MKKIIQLIGGIFVAAILVIAVTVFIKNQIIPRLKTVFLKKYRRNSFRMKKLYKQYVSSDI